MEDNRAPYSAFKSASLKITGVLLPCTISLEDARSDSFEKYSVDVGCAKAILHHDGLIHVSATHGPEENNLHIGREDCSTDCNALGLGGRSGNASLFYLGNSTYQDTGTPLQQIFLVVAMTKQPNIYTRLGVFLTRYPYVSGSRIPYEELEATLRIVIKAYDYLDTEEVKMSKDDNQEPHLSQENTLGWEDSDIQTITII
ncbi:hypothetical protein PtrSN002B_009856 [Pyrenophora tritici-repentis]|nr:hypothetical protein PtrV1_03800 [Pyrenophora tritici-repentis]KAF7451474.1 hypothetical protein A1F99_032510 [Pyrenophora tritici-repentis]KAF7575403.1 hypothetical protein PtrM4_070270 [Pyrenophora tritici-repentis]KAG9385834.1 hypothetical protein A1F94_002584 [Pyrenophora tritici-repentis]KAI0571443.1 hypothetical protein Alg215_10395 [Pyrenophora tritici-repentis]